MAGPLSGVGLQNYPFSTTFQPGNSSGGQQVRGNQEQKAEQDKIQPQGAEASQARSSDADNARNLAREEDNSRQQRNEQRRGSIVDVVV